MDGKWVRAVVRGCAASAVVVAKSVAVVTALMAMVGASLLGIGGLGANTAQADEVALPEYDMSNTKVPSQYNRFKFNTDSGITEKQIVDITGFTLEKRSYGNYWVPSYKGANLTLQHVGQWTDANGDKQWINAKLTINDYTQYMGIQYQSSAVFLSYTDLSTTERFLDVTIDFLLDDGSHPDGDFRGVTGFTDLEVAGAGGYEGVELVSGFDSAYVRGDAHLVKYGTNAWRGALHVNNSNIGTTHGQQHYVGAAFSSSSIRLKYINCVDNGFRTSFFPAPVSMDSWSVAVSKTADKSVVPVGGEITYTVTARNTGTAAAPKQSIFSELGDNLELLNASDDGILQDGKVVWSNVQIPANGEKSFTIKAKVLPSAGEQVTNTATTCDYDGCVPPTCAGGSCMVTTTVTRPQLAVSVKADKPQAKAGDKIVYTVAATNTGQAAATDVRVVDTLSEGLVYVSSTADGVYESKNRTVTWSDMTLEPDESKTLTVTAKVSASAKGQIANTVAVQDSTMGSGLSVTDEVVSEAIEHQGDNADKNDSGNSGNSSADSNSGGNSSDGGNFDSSDSNSGNTADSGADDGGSSSTDGVISGGDLGDNGAANNTASDGGSSANKAETSGHLAAKQNNLGLASTGAPVLSVLLAIAFLIGVTVLLHGMIIRLRD